MQYLDFSALLHNVNFFKKLLGKSRLCAVVKNDAYGHGLKHMARYLDGVVDCFAVGSIAEAKQINFVCRDILLLLPQNRLDAEIAVDAGYILTADSFVTLDVIVDACRKIHKSARVHIKIDSGMSRLGFRQNDIDNLVNYLRGHQELSVEGVYSHFYGEMEWQCDKQLSVFMPCAEALENALNKRLTKHISNTDGALLSPRYHLDMARIGVGLYGYGNDSLLPVKTVKARVIATKSLQVGDVAGYGGKYIARHFTNVAIVNVGYAHGFARMLTDAMVQINGVKCRVIAVCMAMIIVDIGEHRVRVDDEVTLLGNGVNIANDNISVYELLCNLK